MTSVFVSVQRILKPGGYFVVNFGDAYNSGNRFYKADVPSVFPMTIKYFQWGKEANLDLQATRIWRKQFAKMSIPFVCNTHPRNIFDYEHVWAFRKKNNSNKEFVNDRKLSQRGVIGEGWSSPAKLDQHCAAFPVELPLWAISVYSKPDETVLDPFLGSGTTGLAAQSLGRKFIGFEKNKDYFLMAEERLKQGVTIL
jgi:DNA modification methylase